MPSHVPPDGPASEPTGQVEYLGDQRPEKSLGGRRTGLVLGATAAAVGATAAGAWAVAQFMSGGPAPASAVPSNAFVYVSLDLDPEGGQKIEAVQTLRKFPAIREELGIESESDLRRVLFEAVSADSPCSDLDFEADIEPWLGGKLGVAVVPGDAEPTPLLVVQVDDAELARNGVAQIAECSGEDTPGIGFVDDFMVVAENADIADDVVAAARSGSLADDGDYQRWIDEAGGSGVVEGYVSAEAPQYFAEEMPMLFGHGYEGVATESGSSTLIGPAAAPGASTPPPEVTEMLDEFQGAAMVVRFEDEALEVEMAAGGLPAQVQSGGESGIEDLPSSTAVALGFAVADEAVQQMIDGFLGSSGVGEDELDELLAEAEDQTGLQLPEDLQTLLGDGLSLAVDSSIDVEGLVESTTAPTDVPAGVRIVGDPDEITEVIDKLLTAAGPVAGDVVVEEGDGVVAVGLDADYVATLAGDGDLGDQDRFRSALEDVDRQSGAVYVDFDAGDWLTELASTDADGRIEENVEPLDSLGFGGWLEDDVAHGVVRVTTD